MQQFGTTGMVLDETWQVAQTRQVQPKYVTVGQSYISLNSHPLSPHPV
jgi:hypothetical protein